MLKKTVSIFIALLFGGTGVLASCGETISGALSLDDNGADRLTWNDHGQSAELKKTDPIFDTGITTLPTYTAVGNSELPPEIKTVRAEKKDYHFSGWTHLINGQPSGEKPLEDFSSSRMPYSPVTYQAIFKKYLTVTFQPIYPDGEDIKSTPVILEGNEYNNDYYDGALINHRKLEDEVLSVLNARKTEENGGKTEGSFVDIYPTKDFGETKPLSTIELSAKVATYYVVYNEYPALRIYGSEENRDPVIKLIDEKIKTGEAINQYKPSENPQKANAVFEKWYEASNPDGEIFFDKEVMLAGGMNIYPKFLNEIALTFETTDEDIKITNSAEYEKIRKEKGEVRILEGRDLNTKLLASAVKLGWHFEGWYYDVENNDAYDKDTDPLFVNDENVKVKVPLNLRKLNLKPYLTRNSADQAILYVDLGENYDRVDEDALRALGLEPAAQITKGRAATNVRVWSINLAAGNSIGTYLDSANYKYDTKKLFVEDFATVVVQNNDFTDIAHTEQTEPLPSDPANMRMPDNNYAVRLFTQKLFTLKIHKDGEIIPISIKENENVLIGYNDPRLKDYLIAGQTGWSTDESGTAIIEYPFTIDRDDIALYPVAS